MGTQIDKRHLQGLLVPSSNVTKDTLTAQTGLAASSYTQAGAGPGQPTSSDPESKLTLEVSGGQEASIDVQVRRSGLPGRDGLGVIWRADTDTLDADWRSRALPNWVHAWVAAVWTEVDTFDRFDLVVTPTSQQLICVYADESNIDEIFGTVFDFGTGAWGGAVNVSVDSTESGGTVRVRWDWVAGVALPSGRVLAVGNASGELEVFASDDDGATWFAYARNAGAVQTNSIRGRVALYRGELVLFENTAAGQVRQEASNSLGARWSGADNNPSIGTSVSVDVLPDNGGIVLAYIRDADALPVVRVLSSAFQPYSDVPEVQMSASAVLDLAMAVDDNGVVWGFGRDQTEVDFVRVYFSVDGGSSFEELTRGYYSAQATLADVFITELVARFVRGHCVMGHNWSAPTTTAPVGSIGVVFAGGWQTVTGRLSSTGIDSPYQARNSWARTVGSDVWQTQFPIELPANTGGNWAHGGATAPTLVTPGVLAFALVASNGFATLSPATGTPGDGFTFAFHYRIASGTVGTGAFQAGMQIRVADGASDFVLQLKMGNAATVVRDFHGAVDVATIVVDNTTDHDWLVSMNSLGGVVVLYRPSFTTRWIVGYRNFNPGNITDGGAISATNAVIIGSGGGVAITATVHYRHWLVGNEFASTLLSAGLEEDLVEQFGGLLSANPSAVPELGSEDRAGFLSAQRGPGIRGELLAVVPFHEFGIANMFPQVSPSPSRPWRSTDKSEVILAFELADGISSRLGLVWQNGLALLGCNFAEAMLETSQNGTTWTIAATWDASEGLQGLTFERNGDHIRPAAGTVDAARIFARNELAGSYVTLGTTPVKIRGNSPGAWTDPTLSKTQFVEIQLEGITGAEPAAGTCEIVLQNAVLYTRVSGALPTSYIPYVRLRISASQITPDSFYQIGSMVLGSWLVLGKRGSRGWSQAMVPNVARAESRFGVVRKRQQGPPRRAWTWNHSDGVHTKTIRDGGSPDYLTVSDMGGDFAAVALRDDVWTNLWGLLEETGGWVLPLVASARLPMSTRTVHDRTLFLYGTLESSVQFNQVQGDEVEGEFGRPETLAITEQL